MADGLLTNGKTLDGLNYCINQEKYLRVFLKDGEVPIDNSAAERSIRPFTIGRKNWEFMNTIRGTKASAVIYSVVETARLNNLSSYYYVDHLLTELPKLRDENGNIDAASLDQLLPWSETLPVRGKMNLPSHGKEFFHPAVSSFLHFGSLFPSFCIF